MFKVLTAGKIAKLNRESFCSVSLILVKGRVQIWDVKILLVYMVQLVLAQ